jgi:hypothetical protein
MVMARVLSSKDLRGKSTPVPGKRQSQQISPIPAMTILIHYGLTFNSRSRIFPENKSGLIT